MTDNEIIEGLKSYSLKTKVLFEALELINHQKEEIEFLRKTIGKNAKRALDITLEEIEKPRVEAITEFAEKLKESITDCHTVSDGEYVGYDWTDITHCIDNLVKEMVGKD